MNARKLLKLAISAAAIPAVGLTVAPGNDPADGWQAAAILVTFAAATVANLYIALKTDN